MSEQIIISLGSNLGNRLESLHKALALLEEYPISVKQLSRVYETPAWGFESEPFYNAAILIHTSKSAQKILKQVLKVEKSLGRVRSKDSGYQARIIDVDIIAFDEEIIETDNLQIPHPLLQNRKFVLQPMLDLGLNWEHPMLKKSVAQLLVQTDDESEIKAVHAIVSPIEKLTLQQFNYIAIEGNIGAGKTTFSTKLAEDCNAKLVLERFADNAFLPKFYEDTTRYAFTLEMSFLADRYQQISDDLSQLDLFSDFIVSDYDVFKSLIFSKITLGEDEFMLYRKLFYQVYKDIARPDMYIYLYQNTERLQENIRLRGREYEQTIESSYLEKINTGYLEFIKNHPEFKVKIIDISNRDFVKNRIDYLWILEQICS